MADGRVPAGRPISWIARTLLLVIAFGSLSTAAMGADGAPDGGPDEIGLEPFVHGGVDTSNPGWIVSILDNGGYHCAGSLVHSEWVLTAAHCVDDGVSGLTVNVGDDLWFQGSQRFISQAHVHPGYDPLDLTSTDLAMVKLSSPVSGTDLPVITSNPSWPLVDQMVVVAGWGVTSDGAGVPDVLQSAGVLVNSDSSTGAVGDSCPEEAVAASGYDDFCYSDFDSWGCSGDSGGPLIGRATPQHTSGAVETIYGVTSFGDAFSCSDPLIDTVAQGVGRHYNWIRSFFASSPGLGDEMFFYRGDGLFRYYDVGNEGNLSKPILAGDNYTSGWSSITSVNLDGDGQDEMFFYRDDGLFRYYNISATGHVGSPILAGDNYTNGWSSITAVNLSD
jgi:hypothetical protein